MRSHKMSHKTEFVPMSSYQQQQPQQEASENPLATPGEPVNLEVSSSGNREAKEDERSDQRLGEPGYIPDTALNLDFDACFYEHESTKTVKLVYVGLSYIYKYTKLLFYHCFVIVLGIPIALCWGLCNAIIVFLNVWVYLPMMKVFIFWMYACAPIVASPIQAVLTPLVGSIVRIFKQIRIKRAV